MTPQEFYAARLDEDEHYLRTMHEAGMRLAEGASPSDVTGLLGVAVTIMSDPQARDVLEACMEGRITPPNDHQRLLGEVKAKRAILADYISRHEDAALMLGPDCQRQQEWSGLHLALRHHIAVYSDHPDYDKTWSPR